MKQEFKIIMLAFLTAILLSNIIFSPANAQESRKQLNVQDLQGRRLEADTALIDKRSDEAELTRRDAEKIKEEIEKQVRRKQLSQIDQEIERLRQMTREAEAIRARVAQQAEHPEIQPAQPQPRPQAQRQLPSTTGIARREAQDLPQNMPILSRPGVQRVIENIPQAISQLRETFNNNLERVQSAYRGIQERLNDIQSENQRLRNEIQKLREENQNLKNRIQDIEPRRATVGDTGEL
ncbi:MAG: hypothetical protein JW787_07145 [Sedimentisphaerales bacterium]|nr:hypothetical protein [Sedimentisphaerales bacterium]